MAVVELRDKREIAEVCRRNAALHAYELGDLDDFFWPHTRWFGWRRGAETRQIVLIYGEPEPPVLVALADEPHGEMERLLHALLPELPARAYAHLMPHLVEIAAARYDVASHGLHLKMALPPDRAVDGHPGDVHLLGPDDLAAVEAFYRDAYPGTWFVPRMLETMRYVGIRDGGRLACVAGVHVHSPAWGIAALGNVATLPSHRGRGLASAACASLCALLRVDGIDTIALNVKADNLPAIRAYERLGFDVVAEYVEASLVARDDGRAGGVPPT
ncbi:MAG TPA: GNAT family N-acetyltransferase [Gaiella sp.]